MINQVEALKSCVDRMLSRLPTGIRDSERVLAEYDGSKYDLIEKLDAKTWADVLMGEQIQSQRFGYSEECITRGDVFEFGTVANHEEMTLELIKETIQRYPSQIYCELGCGFGRFVKYLQDELNENQHVYGGDFSKNAVAVAQKFNLDVRLFDFTSLDDYKSLVPATTVFTVQAIEQLTSAKCFLDGLRSVRNNINRVIHFEPGPHRYRASMKSAIGHFRNAYTVWNSYNQDLLELLHNSSDIRIVEERFDVLGINPLNPIHVIVWEFV